MAIWNTVKGAGTGLGRKLLSNTAKGTVARAGAVSNIIGAGTIGAGIGAGIGGVANLDEGLGGAARGAIRGGITGGAIGAGIGGFRNTKVSPQSMGKNIARYPGNNSPLGGRLPSGFNKKVKSKLAISQAEANNLKKMNEFRNKMTKDNVVNSWIRNADRNQATFNGAMRRGSR